MKKQTENNKEVVEENDDNIRDIMPEKPMDMPTLGHTPGDILEQPSPGPS